MKIDQTPVQHSSRTGFIAAVLTIYIRGTPILNERSSETGSSEASSTERPSGTRFLGRKWSLARPFSNGDTILALNCFASFPKYMMAVVHWPSSGSERWTFQKRVEEGESK